MKGFTLTEPWASLVAWGYKNIETRSWNTKYRGPLAIHAAKSDKVVKHLESVKIMFDRAGLKMPDWWPRKPKDYPLGKIVAICKLEACVRMDLNLCANVKQQEMAFGAWEPKRWAWYLNAVRRISDGIPCKGALSVWEVPPQIEAMALARSA